MGIRGTWQRRPPLIRVMGDTKVMNDEDKLIGILTKNEMLMEVIGKSDRLQLDSYYIGAGCITQSVWNDLTNRPVNYGIRDLDFIYFDSQDLSYEAEDVVVRRGQQIFPNLPVQLDIKNQARVHVWYPGRFGIQIEPYTSMEEAIDTWPTTSTALGVRREDDGQWKIYAPYGLEDLFNLTVRANKKLISEEVYYRKVDNWLQKWPELNIISWDQS